ncbi:hypothetical protein CAPTEDRAFT_195088 [Capitella teleta]|uniref:CARD domain-containing protein n=1 Tax=Capitella teleta TaxID=283909 RepID=R7UWI7_CAPTE|nr:hypothetical protein CAPTEDRAFT_195088 [Capitella teleta]|eukprot:ELU08302.1 hypothetical protein CAPTEDRAFT_195088 [Capitella teleta]
MALLSEQRKQILTDKRVELVGTIKLHGLWSHLRSRRIVTEQDEARIQLNKTSHEQIGELLDHLAKRTESDFEAFCECLEADNQGHIVTEILRYSAQSPSNKDVREQLVRCYSRLRHISTGPEWTQELALDSAVFYISLHLQKGETATTEKNEIHQDELFAPHQEEKSSSAKRLKPCNPKRILVEGDPGMGKTTLCQNLAFRWGHEKCTEECKCAPCLHSWTFVVYLTAANLKGFKKIHNAVRKHLLPKLSIHKLKAALKSSESKTLFIIDSYDECFKDNVLLHDLIQGRVYANATLLLTSRPNYLKAHLTKAFDSKLSTDGFNREQKRLYVTRFANSKRENESKFEGLLSLINDDDSWNDYDEEVHRRHILSLCSNPLNLAIICLLICSDGLPNITNRTELYKSVTKFLEKKASERMHRPMEEIEADIIRPICRLSFEAYKRNEVSLSKVDLEKVGVRADDILQSGFLTKKIKRNTWLRRLTT